MEGNTVSRIQHQMEKSLIGLRLSGPGEMWTRITDRKPNFLLPRVGRLRNKAADTVHNKSHTVRTEKDQKDVHVCEKAFLSDAKTRASSPYSYESSGETVSKGIKSLMPDIV